MNKSSKEKVFEKYLGDLKGLTSIQKKAVKSATLKAMTTYAALRVKPWRNKFRKQHQEIINLKSWE